MKYKVLILLLFGLALPAIAQDSAVPAKGNVTARAKRVARRAPDIAQLLKNNPRKLRRSVSERFSGILADGTQIDRNEFIAKLLNGGIALGEAEELHTTTSGGTQIKTGLVTLNKKGMIRFTEVWRVINARWQLLSWQATGASRAHYLAKKLAEGRKVTTTDSGLQYIDIVEGDGDSPKSGSQVKVHYTGTLENGQKFDSSVDRGQPFEFTIGIGRVIKGWDEGVMSMKVGGKRKLVVPPQLGYGSRGVGPIPPDSTLIFDVELLGIR